MLKICYLKNGTNFERKDTPKKKGDRHPVGTKSEEIKYTDDRGRNFYRYHTAYCAMYRNVVMGYIQSRIDIYAPVYAWLVVQTPAFIELKSMVDAGTPVQILDMDVLSGSHAITKEFLHEQLHDPSRPFGHGYVLAGLLAGLHPDDYS